jgi:hypothetical protein
MALVRGQVNPLNVLGQRQLKFIPTNFAKMSSNCIENIDIIDQWIYTNLDSRYCVKLKQVVDQSNKITEVLEIGMEDLKELSMFALGCPHIQ